MSYLYPTMEDARDQWPVVKAAITGGEHDPQKVTKAAYVLVGFGASLYPGEPGVFGIPKAELFSEAPEGYGESEMVTDLDETFATFGAAGDEPPHLKAIPWQIVLPLLMTLLQKWLAK